MESKDGEKEAAKVRIWSVYLSAFYVSVCGQHFVSFCININ